MAAIYWFTTAEDPVLHARRDAGMKPLSLREELAPLADLRVWRFSLYYFFVFGGFVALALWLPRHMNPTGLTPVARAMTSSVFLMSWRSLSISR